MKIDRLLAITVHLLNRGTVSAAALAARFEVSKRTIQRDVESLNMAGIPVASAPGAGGGYRIEEGYRLQNQLACEEDTRHIVTAIEAFASAYGGSRAGATLDKLLAARHGIEQTVFMDLSSAREGGQTDTLLRQLDAAIRGKRPVEIEYADAESRRTKRTVEPLALCYRWYAWYLFAYCREKRGYRYFKLPRISSCVPACGSFLTDHGDVAALLREQLREDGQKQYDLRLLCKAEARTQVLEYLRGSIAEERANGDFVLAMRVPFERMWFSLLLGFGKQIQVLEPEEVKRMLKQKAEEILSNDM